MQSCNLAGKEKMNYKTSLKQIDHDCRAGDPNDGCQWCCMVDDLTKKQAKALWELEEAKAKGYEDELDLEFRTTGSC